MSHECPECYSLCYCGGDIDDIDFGMDGEEAKACTHYQELECSGHREYCANPKCPCHEWDDDVEDEP